MNDNETAARERYRLAQAAYTHAFTASKDAYLGYTQAKQALHEAVQPIEVALPSMVARVAEALVEREAAKLALAELLGAPTAS